MIGRTVAESAYCVFSPRVINEEESHVEASSPLSIWTRRSHLVSKSSKKGGFDLETRLQTKAGYYLKWRTLGDFAVLMTTLLVVPESRCQDQINASQIY